MSRERGIKDQAGQGESRELAEAGANDVHPEPAYASSEEANDARPFGVNRMARLFGSR